jgi:phosphoribosylformylglycinamidine (FGAM) synthase-like enzyme
VQSGHDCAEGGLAIALAESCISSNHGALIQLPETSTRLDRVLFAEGGARIIVSVKSDAIEAWETYLQEHLANHWQKLGQVGTSDSSLRILSGASSIVITATIEDMSTTWSSAIERRLEL